MVINENNSQINSFTKGMNSDSSFDQIENSQYIFGLNVRITKNQSLGGHGDYSSLHEGIITPVPNGIDVKDLLRNKPLFTNKNILSVDTIDNLGTIVCNTNGSKDMIVYRFKIDEVLNEITELKEIWNGTVWKNKDVPSKISTVLYKELENVIKLYIATGEHPLICFRIDDDGIKLLKKSEQPVEYVSIDDLMSNRVIPASRIFIEGIISGRLITSLVQYTYRYYNKYGNATQLAPLTNKIQIIDPSRSKEIGNAENTETSIGLSLSIDINLYVDSFKRLLIFRLSYIKPGEDAEVSLIYDGDIKEIEDDKKFVFNDVGIDPIQSLTMEEFSALSGIILIPLVIELNQEYMFCGNIEDNTIIQDVRISGQPRIDLVNANVVLSNNVRGDIPDPGNTKYKDYNTYNIINKIDQPDITASSISTVTDYLRQRGINPDSVTASYVDPITSSLLRSLRRGETYKYAIVFYDKYGRRTDVLDLGEKEIKSYNEDRPFYSADKLIARPIGVNIKIPDLEGDDFNIEDIVGCQIIRRSSSEVYQKTLLLVALARPIQQGLLDVNITDWSTVSESTTRKSPFYPSGFLTVNDTTILPTYYYDALFSENLPLAAADALNSSTRNKKLYQIFSSEIDFRRDDVLSKLNTSDTNISEVAYVASTVATYTNGSKSTYPETDINGLYIDDPSARNKIVVNRLDMDKLKLEDKQSKHYVFDFFDTSGTSGFGSDNGINSIKDVKIANWNSGFTNVTRDGDEDIYDAIKKYRSFTTNIDSYVYNNWASFGKYDLRPGNALQPNMNLGEHSDCQEAQEFLAKPDHYIYWLDHLSIRETLRNGTIGAGPSCFLLTTENETGDFNISQKSFYTSICNITHTPKITNIQSKEFEQYFGFGNYFNLKYKDGKLKSVSIDENGEEVYYDYLMVFDGDVYITPHEFTTMYKTYNFESVDTLLSTQITNYIPLESKVNTFFDYGMNLYNTHSENLLYEPGSIEGITTQERPAHQYNMIYSDNDASNDVFTLISTDKNETNSFRQRAYYSELKSNGEFIDNFLIFKAAAFIDVDSKYGQITNMLTDKNMLYYWQDHAFGKFSVNERSLVNDQNNNTIMLGLAGILSRYDYISTKYGMRMQDLCARTTENGLFWVDINNKAIVGSANGLVSNYGEQVGVLNIINNKITSDIPEVDYDLLNNELLCKCLGDDQIVFNLKYNVATSIYNRRYNTMAYIKNHLYGLKIDGGSLNITKYNYLNHAENISYLSPLILEFIVNPSASVTKVFDSQQLVPIKREAFTNTSSVDSTSILNSCKMAFETDIVEKQYGSSMESYTDREGNIIYNIPRYMNAQYGNRIRGKWMHVSILNNDPSEYFTISHMITKFRQSFS